MSEDLFGLLITVVSIPLILYLVSLINYRIDDRFVRFYWGPIPIRKIAITDIQDVVKGHQHMSESWTNTIWIPAIRRKGVTIYRKTGSFKRVVLTPDDPEGFINKVKNHARYHGER